ncbi:LysM peptidoglycan-binding domain-containing protein [Paenibacillus sp. KN14-4R]|uniref:LysM peptidoglycan-binding domain-containing protein n=1 Tax=Paenibacillus sp. KN14-4R TaxID=3445773 RepID=UPI003F9F8411
MAEKGKGLRFDIYERVHLADESIGIHELNEVELIPHIQVVVQQEQAILKGNLLLTGQYVGEDQNDKRSLEHLIPVEITLPMSRIQKIEDIMVEIENFDVELLSTRNLNVTGVLSLHGVEVTSNQPVEPAWLKEEMSFKHEVSAPRWDQEAEEVLHTASTSLDEPWTPSDPIPSYQPWQSPSDYRDSGVRDAWTAPTVMDQADQVESSVDADTALNDLALQASYIPTSEQLDLRSDTQQQEYEPQIEAYPNIHEAFDQEAQFHHAAHDAVVSYDAVASYDAPNSSSFADDEPKELKVAFASKKVEENTDNEFQAQPQSQSKTFGIQNLIKPSSQIEARADNAAPAAVETDHSRLNGLEWRRLFLREDSENPQFSRVRMYIVQKDDSIEDIARKYSVNQRELLQYNSKGLEDVQAGQILYIPR